MVDLSLNFAGLELKSPLVVASSDNCRDIRQIKEAEECGASAVITKAMLPPDSVGLKWAPRYFIDATAGTLCGIGGSTIISYDQGLELIRAAKKETKIKIGANIPFQGLVELERFADTAKRAADAGADFVEMNFSPQVAGHLGTHLKSGDWQAQQGDEINMLEAIMRELPRWITEAVQTTKQVAGIPIIAKICPEGIDVVAIAKAMESGGTDAIDAVNAGGGAIKIDIFDRGRLVMPAASSASLVTVGAPLKTYAQGVVARISQAVKIPIMGTGGLMNWQDVVEMMMFGATTVSFCTLLMIHGFAAITEIEKRLREFMEQQGYSHLEDFRGLALKNVAPSGPACEAIPSMARIDERACTGCGICLRPAHCVAISMDGGRAVINETECLGCGTCSLLCPAGAISMVETPG
jgi:dihydroorotate dehydrogenase/NAD-dependent dihydropyrimidine dehydrogenase PreA subunit